MKYSTGYYKGEFKLNGFKNPFIVYATSTESAIKKAMNNIRFSCWEGASIENIEGPYAYVDN